MKMIPCLLRKFLFSVVILNSFSAFSVDCDVAKKELKGSLGVILEQVSLEMRQYNSTTSSSKQLNSAFIGADGSILDIKSVRGTVGLVKYSLRHSNDNRIFIDLAPATIEFRNKFACFSGEFVSIEYRKDYDFDIQKEFMINMIDVAGKYRLSLDKNKKYYLEANMDASFGSLGKNFSWGQYAFTEDQYSNTANLRLSYGLKYGINLSKKSSLELGLRANHRQVNFDYYTRTQDKLLFQQRYDLETAQINQRNKDRQAWEDEKYQWEIANGYASSVPYQRYLEMSGVDKKPQELYHKEHYRNYMQKLKRKVFSLNPKIEYTHILKNNSRLHVFAQARFFVKDRLKGQLINDKDYSSALSSSDLVDINLKKEVSLNQFRIGMVFTFGNLTRK
ncbi:MAG: hypothetical protein N4A33_02155 [Bacteriovoracaceae bacterium]|jgi:hypothetical protein|nr:hypothetical protein [Bacteriovoracaceae bacterium]